jgi:hypothetical protein
MFRLKIFYHSKKAAVTHYLQNEWEVPACLTGITWATKLEFHLPGNRKHFFISTPIYGKDGNGEIKDVNWELTPYSL